MISAKTYIDDFERAHSLLRSVKCYYSNRASYIHMIGAVASCVVFDDNCFAVVCKL